MAAQLRVLVVDDEVNIRTTLSVCLEAEGCVVQGAAGASEAAEVNRRAVFDLAFVDLRLGSGDGIELIPRLLEASPGLAIVVITAHASVETVVRAMRLGAYDYLTKPFTPAQIRPIVHRIRERCSMSERIRELEARLSESFPAAMLETSSPIMQSAIETIRQAASSDAAVLLRGESGTGKGVLARLLHDESPRSSRRLVTVNCPTLSHDLLVSELFGHVRGAFTGAVRDQRGRIEEADGGTLFLDEIGEIEPSLQGKLLRFVQEHEFERVGDTQTRRADVRIVTATNRDLESDVATGRFRLDLLYRLNIIEVRVPSLRERPEDLPRLARHFLAFESARIGRVAPELSPDAEQMLIRAPWPGNVRELRNEIERALVLLRGQVLLPESFSERIRGTKSSIPTLGGSFTLREVEREHLLRVLARVGTREEAARVLAIDPSTLWRRLKRYEQGEDSEP